MRIHRTRKADATYDLNLAPFLDIIVSIIPMLLLSVVFVQIRMIETSIPQVVAQKIKEQQEDKKPAVFVSLKIEKGVFGYTVSDNGKKKEYEVAGKNGLPDYDGLAKASANLKRQYVDIFTIDLIPDANVTYDDLVKTLDVVRRLPASEGKVTVKDEKTGQMAETDLMFPNVTFANVVK